MYHPPSKRKQLIQRTITYAFMTFAVISLVTVLVFVMLGYQFNSVDGQIEQGGLVQFDTQPGGASVAVDGRKLTSRTPSKLTATRGQHFVTMTRSGYNMWQKTVSVVPGSVLWLNYARLVPSKLNPQVAAKFPAVSGALASPDMKQMAIKEAPATPEFQLVDLTRDTVQTKKLTLPGDVYTQAANIEGQRFTLSEWDPDSRYVLLKHAYDGKTEWLVVDTQDVSRTKNLTTLLDIDASNVVFHGTNSRILFVQIGRDIRKVDLDAATLSRPLVHDVAEFSLYDAATLLYSTVHDGKAGTRSVGYYRDGTDKPYILRTFKDGNKASLHIALGKYFGDTYEAISYGDTIEILRGDLPEKTEDVKNLRTVASFKVKGGPEYLSVMADGRFVVAQKGASYTVYDLELKKETVTKLKGGVAMKKMSWLDDYTVWSDLGGMLRLYEFDGENQHDIMKVAPGLSVTLSPNGKYLYGINKAKDGTYVLQRVQMIL